MLCSSGGRLKLWRLESKIAVAGGVEIISRHTKLNQGSIEDFRAQTKAGELM